MENSQKNKESQNAVQATHSQTYTTLLFLYESVDKFRKTMLNKEHPVKILTPPNSMSISRAW